MKMRRSRLSTLVTHSPAFTLVEMLVATALTVLIMMMFAQIYGTALGTISNQRGIANNDQKARIIGELLRGDLQNMTYRQPGSAYGNVRGIVAMSPGDEVLIDPIKQQGYFYFSENEIGVDTDDVLQFTIWIPVNGSGNHLQTADAIPLLGRAQNLGIANEPELDDGFPGDGRGRSRAAEVCYFLRGGNLYRRVLLLRDPLNSDQQSDPQPTKSDRSRLFGPSSRNYIANSFWNDFDYSATRIFDDPSDSDSNGLTSYLWFNSISSLSNAQGTRNHPIALPWNRFGHLNDQRGGNTNHGMPREWLTSTATSPAGDYFLGRLTHTETSSSSATYPGNETGYHYQLFSRTNSGGMTYDTSLNTIYELEAGTRWAEDLVAANVEAFDVKVWDDASGMFVDLGYGSTYSTPKNQNKLYGSRIASSGADGAYGNSSVDDDGNGTTDDFSELGWPGSDDTINRVFDTWHPNTSLNLGSNRPPYAPVTTTTSQIVYWQKATALTVGTVYLPFAVPGLYDEDFNGNRVLDSGEDLNGNDLLDTYEDANNNNTLDSGEDLNSNSAFDLPRKMASASLRAVVVKAGTTGTTAPEWPLSANSKVYDGSVIWEIQDNRIGLKAIQVTVRYKDVQSGSPRQVTLEHSFVE
jgi:hypothetical protein